MYNPFMLRGTCFPMVMYNIVAPFFGMGATTINRGIKGPETFRLLPLTERERMELRRKS